MGDPQMEGVFYEESSQRITVVASITTLVNFTALDTCQMVRCVMGDSLYIWLGVYWYV
jgi:hypothetical protein